MYERRTPRFTLGQVARIEIYGGMGVSLEGSIDNVSKNGIGLILHEPVDCDNLVRVDLNEYVLVGEIRHCEKTSEGYAVGVELFECVANAELKRLFEHVLISSVA